MEKQLALDRDSSEIDDAALTTFCARLQPLPSVIRYYDEFDDKTRSIPAPNEENVFEIFSRALLKGELCPTQFSLRSRTQTHSYYDARTGSQRCDHSKLFLQATSPD